jgi:hypothetical protein
MLQDDHPVSNGGYDKEQFKRSAAKIIAARINAIPQKKSLTPFTEATITLNDAISQEPPFAPESQDHVFRHSLTLPLLPGPPPSPPPSLPDRYSSPLPAILDRTDSPPAFSQGGDGPKFPISAGVRKVTGEVRPRPILRISEVNVVDVQENQLPICLVYFA